MSGGFGGLRSASQPRALSVMRGGDPCDWPVQPHQRTVLLVECLSSATRRVRQSFRCGLSHAAHCCESVEASGRKGDLV